MRVTVNVECSPEEAREFMGLPDVRPVQEALMREIQGQMVANMRAVAPEAIAASWLPAGMQGAEQFQKLFWGQFQNTLDSLSKATTSLTFTSPDLSSK